MYISNLDQSILLEFNSFEVELIKKFIRNKCNLPTKTKIILIQSKYGTPILSNDQLDPNRIVYFMLEDILLKKNILETNSYCNVQ